MLHCKKTRHDLRYLRVIPVLVQYTIFIVYSDRIFRMTGREGRFRIIFRALFALCFPFEGGDLFVSREPERGGVEEGPALSARFLSWSLLIGLFGVSGFAAIVADAIAVETAGEVWLFFE